MTRDYLKHVSQSPTNPQAAADTRSFDVADLFRGPIATPDEGTTPADVPLDEKLRQAYFWIVNHAIISPFYDIEYNPQPPQVFTFGDARCRVSLPSGQSYSSFALLPLLTFATRRKCLLVGGPGRGKTASAVLMGVLAGYTLNEVRRGIQKGQPQMTVADLLGAPLPSALMQASRLDQVAVGWRSWLEMRVKIVDEYNRIPTRTQSALLTLMADNYAELFDQTYECPDSAWFLTANDDAGGGTYQVIEALRDRIDIVVKALHFNTRFLGDLLERIEAQVRPEEHVPRQIVFTHAEWDRMYDEILAVDLPQQLLRRVEFFASQFEYFEPAAMQLEYRTKDTAKLSGMDWQQLVQLESGKDPLKDLGGQTRNGLSVRTLMTVLVFVKALAYFRGTRIVTLEDVRQILPFVLHDKLQQHRESAFFDAEDHATLRSDKIGWIRRLFDLSCAEYERLNLDRDDVVAELSAEFERGLEGLSARDVRKRLANIEHILKRWSTTRKFYGHMFDDVLKLKYLHQRYTNYLHWLEWNRSR